MNIDLSTLSSDVSDLHKTIAKLALENSNITSANKALLVEKSSAFKENNEVTSQNTELKLEIESLNLQLKLFRAQKYGKSSEKLNNHINQLSLFLEENEIEASATEELEPELDSALTEEDKNKSKNCSNNKQKPKRQQLPKHLPREEVILAPEKECPKCGKDDFRQIGEDRSEVLEYVPASFKVICYVRPRCACKNCEKIVQAYPASKPIDKGIAGSGLLAHILVQKYCNHLPIYRQSQIYSRENIDLPESTMCGWIGKSVKLLSPLIAELKKEIFAANYLHGDDTTIKVLDPGRGKTKTGRIWVYARDGRARGDDTPPAVCYYYSPDRKGIRPMEHLQDFKGVFHADAYSGYDKIYKSAQNPESQITEAACWAHTRRKFYEITVANDKANIAISVLEEISSIYHIESEVRGKSPDERKKRRQKESKPLVAGLFNKLKKYYKDLPKKSVTAQAIAYALNHELALRAFLEDGSIEIDNNTAERAMRSIAIGRKNWLFAGSDAGGETAAAIYSLIETAKLNNINPWKYLEKVLRVIQDHNHKKLSELLPWNIKL